MIILIIIIIIITFIEAIAVISSGNLQLQVKYRLFLYSLTFCTVVLYKKDIVTKFIHR